MKILFIHPPLTGEERYGKFKEVGSYLPPLGLCYIAAVLEKQNIDVQIIDGLGENLSIDDICNMAKRYSPDYVGITIASIAYSCATVLAGTLKKELGDIPVIVGGPHVTIFREKALDSPHFDYGVIGEGEVTFLELIEALNKNQNVSRIDGILYKKRNEIFKTSSRPFINNLDELPLPARHLLPPLTIYRPTAMVYKKFPVTTMITSRGCPYNCIFCNRIFGKYYRFNSAEYVVREMEILVKKFGIKEITFYEDNFPVNKKRVFKICALIKERQLNVRWSCSANVNTLNKEMLMAMKEAGCWLVSIGIESGNEEVLKFIRKDISPLKVKQVAQWASEIGIQLRGYFMIGHPIDTKKTIRQTIDFSKSLRLYTVNFCLQYLVPGSELYEIAPLYGETCYDFTMVSGHPSKEDLPFVPKGLTTKYLLKIQGQAYREFYLRPSQLWRMIKIIDSWKDVLKCFSMIRTFIRVTF